MLEKYKQYYKLIKNCVLFRLHDHTLEVYVIRDNLKVLQCTNFKYIKYYVIYVIKYFFFINPLSREIGY